MVLKQTLRQVGVLLLLSGVMASSTASAYSLFTCRDGVARAKCCCPEEEPTAPASESSVSSTCCTVEHHEVEPPASEAPRPTQVAPPHAVSTAWSFAAAPSSPLKLSLALLRDKPDSGPPILRQTQSLLI